MKYSELKAAIQDYTQNSEATFVSNINNFIIAAEDVVFMAIPMPAFWKSDLPRDCVGGTAEYELDAGVLDIFSVRIGEVVGNQDTGVTYGPSKYLLLKNYDFLLEAYPGSNSEQTTGVPKYYAISSAGVVEAKGDPTMTIRLGPAPDKAYPFTVDYYGKTASDSITEKDDKETWLSVTAPDVLLYGSILQAYVFMKGEPEMIQAYDGKFKESLGLLKNLVDSRQVDDNYVSKAPDARVQ